MNLYNELKYYDILSNNNNDNNNKNNNEDKSWQVKLRRIVSSSLPFPSSPNGGSNEALTWFKTKSAEEENLDPEEEE